MALVNKTQPNKHLGIVMSASHNKREDNGLKITNFRGNMLEKHYEPKVEEFVNEPDLIVAVNNFKGYLKERGLTFYDTEVTTLIGGDFGPSTDVGEIGFMKHQMLTVVLLIDFLWLGIHQVKILNPNI